MHSMNWRQRNRNLNRFFFKRTGFFSPKSFSPKSFSPKSFSSRDVPHPPPRDSAQLQAAGDEAANQQGENGETKVQQTQLRARKQDETRRLLLPSDGHLHDRCAAANASTRSG